LVHLRVAGSESDGGVEDEAAGWEVDVVCAGEDEASGSGR
jgi:hypothetical protein